MQHKDKVVLQKICREIDLSKEFFGNSTLEEFLADEKTKHSVGMAAINIGELVKNLDVEFRKKYSEVAWKDAARFRDVVAHKYETLDMEDVYNTIKYDFPELKLQIEKILETE